MKVKEAIECIKNRYDDVWLEGNCRIGQKELWRERDKVISLLQQGEALKAENVELKKYKGILQLVEEKKIQAEISDSGRIFFILEANDKSNKIMFSLRAPFRHLLCHTLEELEQKYLKEERK